MIYVLADLAGFEGFANLFRYITFRAGAALLTALLIALLIATKTLHHGGPLAPVMRAELRPTSQRFRTLLVVRSFPSRCCT